MTSFMNNPLGEHLMRKGVFDQALVYITQALFLNPDSKVRNLARSEHRNESTNIIKIGQVSLSYVICASKATVLGCGQESLKRIYYP